MAQTREIDIQEGLRASKNELSYFLVEPDENTTIVVHKQFILSCIVGWEWETDYLKEEGMDYMAVEYLILMKPPTFQPSLVSATILVEKHPPAGYISTCFIYPTGGWIRKKHMGATATVLSCEAYKRGIEAAKEVLGDDEVSL